MAHVHHFSAKLTWTGAAKGTTSSYESYSRDHLIEVPGKPPLPGSADKVFRGDSSRHNPEELLVMSLSACHMLTYLAVAARAGVHVVAYSDAASGTMQLQEGKMRFTEVGLRAASWRAMRPMCPMMTRNPKCRKIRIVEDAVP